MVYVNTETFLNLKSCCKFFYDVCKTVEFARLENFVDISDPDISLPNYHHGIQTAEGIRADGHPEWLQLVGLIHDFGKILYLKGCDNDGTSESTQWGIVGDTFIVGCKIPNTIVYPEYNKLNQDNYDT